MGDPCHYAGKSHYEFEFTLESSGGQNKYLPPRDVDGERFARPEIKANHAVVNDVGKTHPGWAKLICGAAASESWDKVVS